MKKQYNISQNTAIVTVKHKDFIGKVLCSKGIGAGYIKRDDAKKHTYNNISWLGKTIETYRLRNGSKINLPIYYRNQLFTEKEREALFLDKIEKGIIYVMGQKVHRWWRILLKITRGGTKNWM